MADFEYRSIIDDEEKGRLEVDGLIDVDPDDIVPLTVIDRTSDEVEQRIDEIVDKMENTISRQTEEGEIRVKVTQQGVKGLNVAKPSVSGMIDFEVEGDNQYFISEDVFVELGEMNEIKDWE